MELNTNPCGSSAATVPHRGTCVERCGRRRILIDAVSTVLAGGITYMSCLVNAMARLAPAWQMDVYVGSEELARRLEPLSNIRVRLVSGRSRSWARFIYRQLVLPARALVGQVDAALVQFPGLFLRTTPQVMLALNSHYVIDPPVARTLAGAMKQRIRRFLFTIGYRIVDKTVFVSWQMREMACRWFGPACSKGVVVYEGVNPRLLSSEPARHSPGSEREFYFLAVGTVSEHKNYETMIRAFASFRRSCPEPATLRVAGHFAGMDAFRNGQGPMPPLLALVEELGVAESVFFLGSVSDEELFSLLLEAGAFVTTSLLEAFNLTVAEAMAVGIPVIVPNTSSYPEVVGDAGVYHDPTNPESVAMRLRVVREDATLRRRLGELGRARARRYTWESAAEKVITTLAAVMGGRSDGMLASADDKGATIQDCRQQ